MTDSALLADTRQRHLAGLSQGVRGDGRRGILGRAPAGADPRRRTAAADLASERGVSRITATPAEGDQRVFYGRSHTFARAVDGR